MCFYKKQHSETHINVSHEYKVFTKWDGWTMMMLEHNYVDGDVDMVM